MKSVEERGANSIINREGKKVSRAFIPSIQVFFHSSIFHLSNFGECFCKTKSFGLRSLEQNKIR